MTIDTEGYKASHDDGRRHDVMTHRELSERLDRMEQYQRDRAKARHETNDKIHSILGELSVRVDKAEDEITTLSKTTAEQVALLRDIRAALTGSETTGSVGLVKRLEMLEARVGSLETKLFIATGALTILGFIATLINWKGVLH